MTSLSDRQNTVDLIDEAVRSGARRVPACAELKISPRTLKRWVKEGKVCSDQRPLVTRPEPSNKLSEEDRKSILTICNSVEFSSLPPSQIVPRLADKGQYLASESSYYRILRAEGQQHHRGRAKAPVKRKKPTSYEAVGPCQVWSWDITWLPGPIAGTFFYLYLILDIFSRKIVGWEIHDCETSKHASALIKRAVLAENCITEPLVLHADNGSPMKGATMKVTMEKLGITASYSRPRVSNDNPFSEALFRTCKYRPNWPSKGFTTKIEAQTWVKSFVQWYNCEHHHSAIKFITPAERHAGNEQETLSKRAILYANARAQNPQRWSGKTRNWQPAGPVWLNPETEISAPEIRDAA